jgi:hypothetical protein
VEHQASGPNDHKRHVAPLGRTAAWARGQCKPMENHLEAMKLQSADKAFFWHHACIMLVEFEEIITYQKSEGDPMKQATMRET